MNYNKVILGGRMTGDPQLKLTESGLDVCGFSLAINRKRKEPEPDEVCFIDCTAFGKTASVIGKHFTKGEPILIEGRLKFRQWGGQSGKAEKKHEIVVDRFEFVGGNRDSNAVESSTPQPGAPSTSPIEDNDVPF